MINLKARFEHGPPLRRRRRRPAYVQDVRTTMLRPDLNERLCRVAAGTPAGELYRRYWLPVATESEMVANPVKRVRLLGQDLVLFRSDSGVLGLDTKRCPNRGASFGYGFPEGPGLRRQ